MMYIKNIYSIKLTPVKHILFVSALIVFAGNFTFFTKVESVYPWAEGNLLFILSLVFFHFSLLSLLMIIFSLVMPVRLVIGLFVILAAVLNYYSGTLGIVIDTDLIRTMFQTNVSEALDLLNSGFLMHVLLFGLIPVVLLSLVPLYKHKLAKSLIIKSLTCVSLVVLLFVSIFSSSEHYASFFREHKPLRNYLNPTASVLHMARFIKQEIKSSRPRDFVRVAEQVAKHEEDDSVELVIMVVGETARSDHFSLNGYPRQTNPRLALQENIISYKNISSCGTLTAISVPCMFSYLGRNEFDRGESRHIENVLDLLSRTGVNILWRDNNSSSKGVADRVAYESFRSPDVNSICDVECRDEGMLQGLQEYIDKQSGDILIVLHSMGSHGPAYYKRYPKAFETFTPACNTLELSQCSHEEIINAYDNTIVYTDYFLSRVIELLKKNTPKYETSMFYVSDHGESLGESGLYLHGMPYLIAPESQTKVPVIVWAGDSSDINIIKSKQLENNPNTHDAVFDVLMSLFEAQSELKPSSPMPLVYLKDEYIGE